MQAAYNFFGVSESLPKSIKKERLRVTPRDLEIIKYVIDMKFALIENIHSMFFQETRFGNVSGSLIWTKQRVRKLIEEDFLRYEDIFAKAKPVVATQKGFLYLKNSWPSDTINRPATSIDLRTFNHDLKVNNFRCYLHKSQNISSWISEKQIAEANEYKNLFTNEYRPDGIYIDLDGKRNAFELEISRKSKDRYKLKIRKYIQLILKGSHSPKIIDGIHYVCENPEIKKIIENETRLFRQSFRVDALSDFQDGFDL